MRSALRGSVDRDGFAFIAAEAMRPLLGAPDTLSDWHASPKAGALFNSTRTCPTATAIADAATQSCRRAPAKTKSSLSLISRTIKVSTTTRWSAASSVGSSRCRRRSSPARRCGASLRSAAACSASLRPNTSWKIECHQFRIEARSDAPGRPTPGGRASRRRRLRAGAADQSNEHQERHDHRARPRRQSARQFYADGAAGRRDCRRRASQTRRNRGRADRPDPRGVSRCAGCDI